MKHEKQGPAVDPHLAHPALTVIGLLLLFERSGISYRVSHVETEFLSMDFVKQSKRPS